MSAKGMKDAESFDAGNAFNRADVGKSFQAQSKRPLALGNQARMVSEAGSMANLEQRNKFAVNA